MKKVAVALSGGVDSAVAALSFLRHGCEVVGLTMFLHRCGKKIAGESNVDTAAAEVCRVLGIEHKIVDLEKEFTHRVLESAWRSYDNGLTPNPCAVCNRHVKFGALLEYALCCGADALATGHHARVYRTPDFCAVRKGVDARKDQSYFLFALTGEQLSKVYLPVGDMTKDEVRRIAMDAGLPNHDKQESQDSCFGTAAERFSETLRNMFEASPRPGRFVSPQGECLGRHEGIHLFTVGQRRGLGIALGAPAYVVSINPATADVLVSTDESLLFSDSMDVADINWQIHPRFIAEKQGTSPSDPLDCGIRIRYRSCIVPAKLTVSGEYTASARFASPQRAITPGQAAVFYDGDLLIGGGWIQPKIET